MAGRGRGKALTMPAWMQRQNAAPAPSVPKSEPPSSSAPARPAPGQFEDAPVKTESAHDKERKPASEKDEKRRDRDQDRSKSRSSRHHRSRHRDRSRDRDRDRDRHRRSRRHKSRSRSGSPVKIVRKRKKNMFDVYPPGVTEENAAAYAAQAILEQNMQALQGAVGPASFGPPNPSFLPSEYFQPKNQISDAITAAQSQQTRHARRMYVGGIDDVTEKEISDFFNDVIDKALGEKQEGGAVVSVYINKERHFAFVELKSIELTTACMNLDGISFRGQPVKVRRPNDYNPTAVPKDLGPIPELNLGALGVVSTTVGDGPGKVFVGGIPYHLGDGDVKELLQAFGPLKSFHLVKDLGTGTSKGYGFCEYADESVTDVACAGLDNMTVGDKTLTVRRASAQDTAAAMAAGPAPGGALNGLDPSQAALQTMSMAGISGTGIPKGTPSKVLVLLDMVLDDELNDDEEYADIMDDIKTECERFGRVQALEMPRSKDGHTRGVGKVFVGFADKTAAQAAAAELHGRGFANRTVSVEYMDETKFAARNLD